MEELGGYVMTLSIKLDQVGLAYRLSQHKTGSFKDFALSLVRGNVRYERFWAVRNVDLEVSSGEVLGVIGRNGAGKSTLMRTIAGVLPPTEGRVVVNGFVSPLIELGAGFNADLTARENVILYGALLGESASDMTDRVPAILAWADLEDFEHVPIRSFSSGMMARLGFSVATDIRPEVLIIDEVFAVGDEAFRVKSTKRIEGLISSGATVILVSHDLRRIEQFADRVLWLDRGEPRMIGDPESVTKAYRDEVSEAAATEDGA